MLENDVVVGGVNVRLCPRQNKRDLTAPARHLRIPVEHIADTLTAHPNDVNVVLTLS
jgi:hypothetical protein